MAKNKEAVILYSGGTDSTCAVFLKAPEFEKIHLISYRRYGIFNTSNIDYNVARLQALFGKDKFVRTVIDIDKMYKLVVYDDYFKNLFKFGFFNLAVCGLCKMAMHMRTILYCIDNGIDTVFDGANKDAGSGIATDQVKEVVSVITDLYKSFNISYSSPVYEMNGPKNLTWQAKLGLSKEEEPEDVKTTGTFLKEKGFFDSDNVKGSLIDKKMQARCFQQFLSNMALNSHFIEKYGVEKYKKTLHEFFTAKSKRMTMHIKDFLNARENSRLFRYKQ
ncbi:MAG: hypothetical protein VB017_04110 [Endomicrobiaceae bacterium]|nr:hypothetical protein [Endomicrobiaceae bacterium]